MTKVKRKILEDALNEAKREEDEFKKLSPKEKKQRIAELREKRNVEIEKMKAEKKIDNQIY